MTITSQPWLKAIQTRLLGIFDPRIYKVWDILSLSDWQDHSIICFKEAFEPYYHKRLMYAVAYSDKIYRLDNEKAFMQYLIDSRLELVPSLKDHLAAALAGSLRPRLLIHSLADVDQVGVNLAPYFRKYGYEERVKPPEVGATEGTRYLALWIYNSYLIDKIERWLVIQSKDDLSRVELICDDIIGTPEVR
jgi:hypothetical protein